MNENESNNNDESVIDGPPNDDDDHDDHDEDDNVALSLNEALKALAEMNLGEINELKDGQLYEDEFFELFTSNPDDAAAAVDDNEVSIDSSSTDCGDGIVDEIVWLRPFKIESRCEFGADRFIRQNEIVQGNLNDCAFCAATSSLANYPQLLRRVLPPPNTSTATYLYGPAYKGYFKFKFWVYGEWIDVYIDDRLPTKNKKLLYCRCSTSNVFWAPLLEKAYAKLKGSYLNLVGINTVTVLTELTGGMFLTLNTQTTTPALLSNRIRVENEAVSSSSSSMFVACASIKKEFTLSGNIGHAYSLLSINCLRIDGEMVRVYTLRNPHGKAATETDRYRADSTFWKDVDESTRKQMFYDSSRAYRETISWFSSTAFNRYFDEIALLYYIPDLTATSSRSNNLMFEFQDEWEKESARHDTKHLIFNQHYLLEVKETESPADAGIVEAKKTDVLLNLIQEELSEHEKCSISFYVFPVRKLPPKRQRQISAKSSSNRKQQLLHQIGTIRYELENGKTYYLSRNLSAFFDLLPGHYVILPVVREASMKTYRLNFLFRVVSNGNNNNIGVERLNLEPDSFKLYTDDVYVNLISTKCNACNRLIGSGMFKVYNEMSYHNECYDKLVDCLYDCCRESMKTFCLTDVGLKYCKKCHDKYWKDDYLNV